MSLYLMSLYLPAADGSAARYRGAEAAVAAQARHGRVHRGLRDLRAEPGSDAASMRTRAGRHGDAWILHGTKRFITNGSLADVVTVVARTEPEAPAGQAFSASSSRWTCPASASRGS